MSAEAKATLEGWLFDEGLNHSAALERAQKELGFTGSVSSLKRFYQRRGGAGAQNATLSDLFLTGTLNHTRLPALDLTPRVPLVG